jgi:acyl carrier protein
VQETVVMAREDTPGEKRLVAYVAADQEPAPAISELRRLLQEKLPKYMMPSAFVLLESLPLTPNGKVDRRALPVPDPAKPEVQGTFMKARSVLEMQLVNVWERLLNVQRVGTQDNFFELGGTSLLAVRLFNEIEKLTGKSLPIEVLFRAPTIEQLADILRQEGWSTPWSSLVPIQPAGSRLPLFCTHARTGHILFLRDLPRHLGPDQPVYGLQAQGLDGKEPPRSRVEDMAADYIKEIRSLQPEGPYLLAGMCLGGMIAFEMAQRLQAQGQKTTLIAMDCVPLPWISTDPKFIESS